MILDNVGNRSLLDCRRVLAPGGRYFLIGGGGVSEARWLGQLPKILRKLALSPFVSQDMRVFMANMNRRDLNVLAEMMQDGRMTPVVDRCYALADARAALEPARPARARADLRRPGAGLRSAPPLCLGTADDPERQSAPVADQRGLPAQALGRGGA